MSRIKTLPFMVLFFISPIVWMGLLAGLCGYLDMFKSYGDWCVAQWK
jgi:hypothetical protein